jgi:ABC-2 type transport system ATP-binding protein
MLSLRSRRCEHGSRRTPTTLLEHGTYAAEFMQAMIDFSEVVFDYPGHRALHGVSGQIAGGTVTAMVGPNGAGKTTLLRCLAALDAPFSGRVAVDGIDVIADPRAGRARLGFLQDLFGLYDELSARRCLIYAAASRGVERGQVRQRVDEVAQRLNLTALLDKRAGTLSRGQRQRLAIGQTIIHRPKVLLLDEPSAGLDPEARAELSALLKSLCREGMTLVVSSHILSELQDYSTRLMVVDRGRILEHGPIVAPPTAKRRFTVKLAAAAPSAVAMLRERGDVIVIEAEDAQLVFDFTGDLDSQAALLAALIGAGARVASFAEATVSLEAIYLDRVRADRAAAAR